MKYIYTILTILIFYNFNVNASDLDEMTKNPFDNIIPPSPQAQGLARYGEYPVSPATGVPDITIPIYEIKMGSYTLPISISYHTSGIKLDDVASTVGLGWSLNAGGIISRTVNGAPDLGAYWSQKFYDTSIIDHMLETANYTKDDNYDDNIVQFCNFYNERFDTWNDAESDRYTFNFAGKTGVFYYSYKAKEFMCLNHENIYIEGIPCVGPDSHDSWFRIIDTNGYEYFFCQPEFVGTRSEENRIDISGWYLTKIRTPYGDIVFSYVMSKEFDLAYKHDEAQTGRFISQEIYYSDEESQTIEDISSSYRNCTEKEVSRTNKTYRIPVVASISWNNNSILFSYENDRKDIWKTRLSRIDVVNSDKDTIKSAILENDYYWGNITSVSAGYSKNSYRMLLKGMKLSDCGNYKFAYNEFKESLPAYEHCDASSVDTRYYTSDYYQTDYWGYYNGKKSKTLIPKEAYNYVILNNYFSKWMDNINDYADRTVSEYHTQLGVISSITYPTGGKSIFKFESNKNDAFTVGGLRVASITSYDKDNKKQNTKTYKYLSSILLCDNQVESMVYKSHIISNYYERTGFGLWECHHYSSAYTCSSEPLNALTNSAVICYDKIQEIYDDGSFCEYKYDPYGNPEYDKYIKINIKTTLTHIGNDFLCEVPYVNDLGTITPNLIQKTYYDSNNNLIQTEKFYYENYEKAFNVGTKIVSNVINYDAVDGKFRGRWLRPCMVSKKQ